MAIKLKTQIGNLLHMKSGHVVHGCNAQGVMGSGVALGVKNTWPNVFQDYRKLFEDGELKLGTAYPTMATPTLVVWNAVTQNLYGTGRRLTNYEAVATCFETVNEFLHRCRTDMSLQVPNEVYIPLIGAARGGGSWRVIEAIIEETMDFSVTLITPDNTVTTI